MAQKQIETVNNRVEHPNHYNWITSIECLDVVEYFNFNLGCVIKYVWRAPVRHHTEQMTDLYKAKFYIQREIERLEREYVKDGV